MTIRMLAGSGPQPWWAWSDPCTGRGAQLFGPYGEEMMWKVGYFEEFRDPPLTRGFQYRSDAEYFISEWLHDRVLFEQHHTERIEAFP